MAWLPTVGVQLGATPKWTRVLAIAVESVKESQIFPFIMWASLRSRVTLCPKTE